jgi:hypothetical protein
MMQRVRADPENVHDAPIAELPPTSDMWVPGARRRVLAQDPATDAITYVSEIPVGYRRQVEVDHRREHPAGRFEFHHCHEEGFILAGRYDFGGWYDWNALSYLNHPSTWVHPADQHAPDGARLIMKMSAPLDFVYRDIPSDWDGVEFPADPERAGGHRGVSSRPLDPDGGRPDRTGRRWQRLWHDVVNGWTTWLVVVPPSWRGSGDGRTAAGGDELFLLSGDVRTRVGGDLVDLREGDYVCDTDRFEDGGATERSGTGCLMIRWTRGVDPRS